jgi:hypothetical protein
MGGLSNIRAWDGSRGGHSTPGLISGPCEKLDAVTQMFCQRLKTEMHHKESISDVTTRC